MAPIFSSMQDLLMEWHILELNDHTPLERPDNLFTPDPPNDYAEIHS